MSHDANMTPNTGEDDWDTDDLNVLTQSFSALRPKPQTTLRASANEFKPQPKSTSAPQAPGRKEEDDWFGVRRPVSNRQIWDSANAAQGPSILSPTSQLANGPNISNMYNPQPAMQILKRPSPSSSNQQNVDASNRVKTLEEREEEYRLARERIFGAGAGSQSQDRVDNDKVRKDGRRGGSPVEYGLIPTQVKRGSPGPGPGHGRKSGASTPGGSGVVRQPLGPGEGGGFGRG